MATLSENKINNEQKVYLIHQSEWNDWDEKHIVACTLSKEKAERVLKKLESSAKVVGKHEDGEKVYEFSYWIEPHNLIE